MKKSSSYSQKRKTLAVIQSIHQAAKIFDSKLIGKTFLYIYEGKAIEVVYRATDFLHLTGVDTALSASAFYRNAKSGKLSAGQIFFSARHPYDLSKKKVVQLLNIELVTNSPLLILESMTTQTHTFKFGLTELNFSVCLDPDLDFNGKLRSNYYIARSLRVEDSFSKGQNAYEVNCIFSKSNDKAKYDCIMYKDGKTNIVNLPNDILKMLDENLYPKTI